jgi:hypothetical protein
MAHNKLGEENQEAHEMVGGAINAFDRKEKYPGNGDSRDVRIDESLAKREEHGSSSSATILHEDQMHVTRCSALGGRDGDLDHNWERVAGHPTATALKNSQLAHWRLIVSFQF